MIRRVAGLMAFFAMLSPQVAGAHDASSFGGLFRSHTMGETWLNADVGLFLNAALTVAVSPLDPNHLLMGTDIGVLRSHNGGRSWSQEAPHLISGAVFAIGFAPDGESALCAAPGGVFRFHDAQWTRVSAPAGASPARTIVFGAAPSRVYLLGAHTLFVSDDGGRSFVQASNQLDGAGEIEAFALSKQPRELLLAVADGKLLLSEDGGRVWHHRSVSADQRAIETGVFDPVVPGRLWSANQARVYVSGDLGLTWRGLPQSLPQSAGAVRGLAADAKATKLVVTTAGGMFRSDDAGQSWQAKQDNLPVHLEAGPLVRDPSDPGTLYAVYSLVPYGEVWRAAVQGGNLLSRVDLVSLAGAVAFFLLFVLVCALLVRFLMRLRSASVLPSQPTT